MKLRTKMYPRVAGSSIGYLDSGDVDHDAACAHALMLAMRQYESDFPLSAAAPQDVIQWVEKRASELMRSWGFDSGEVEGER